LSYETIIKNPQYFAQFEEQLFANDFISKDYNFQKGKVKINDFACIYIALIKKGYFNKKDFTTKKEIKLLDVRKFLDNRYNSNFDKQFRTFLKLSKEVAEFISNHYWIDNLPPC
jgi:uncharacterized membrane protein